MKIKLVLPHLLLFVIFSCLTPDVVASSPDNSNNDNDNDGWDPRNYNAWEELRQEDPETLGLIEQVVHAMLVEHKEDNASSCQVTCKLGDPASFSSGTEWHISPDYKSMFVRASSKLRPALVNTGLEISVSKQCPTSIRVDVSVFSNQVDEILPSSFVQAKTIEDGGDEKKPNVYVRPTTPDDEPYRFFNIEIRAKDSGKTISVDSCRVVITPSSMVVGGPLSSSSGVRGGGRGGQAYLPIRTFMTEKDIQEMHLADRNTFKVGGVSYTTNYE